MRFRSTCGNGASGQLETGFRAYKPTTARFRAVLLGEVWVQGCKHCFEFVPVDEATVVGIKLARVGIGKIEFKDGSKPLDRKNLVKAF